MSEEHVRRLRAAFDAYDQGDFETATRPFQADVRWRFPAMAIGFQELNGKEGIVEFWRSLDEAFENFVLDPIELMEADGQTVLAHLRFEGRGRESGIVTCSCSLRLSSLA